jgi:hypothetical protein
MNTSVRPKRLRCSVFTRSDRTAVRSLLFALHCTAVLLHVGGCIASAHTLPRPKLSGGQRAAAAPSFGTIDHDGDGRVGAAELTAWFAIQQGEMSSRAIPASRAYRTPLACKLHFIKGTAVCDVHQVNYRLIGSIGWCAVLWPVLLRDRG